MPNKKTLREVSNEIHEIGKNLVNMWEESGFTIDELVYMLIQSINSNLSCGKIEVGLEWS